MSRRGELDKLLGPCPLEQAPFSERLTAHVCSEHGARVHGYALQGDLARHYGLVEVVLLTLTGELPASQRARAAEIALVASCAVKAGDAAAHATIAARVCGGERPALSGIAAVALAEGAQALVAGSAELLSWLDAGATAPAPEGHERADGVKGLYGDFEAQGIELPASFGALRDEALLIAVLHWAGLRAPAQIEAALLMVRLPVALAEAYCHVPRDFLSYPMNLPRFVQERER